MFVDSEFRSALPPENRRQSHPPTPKIKSLDLKKITPLDFARLIDDCVNREYLHQSDIILFSISGVGKSSQAERFADLGLYAGNMSIILDVDFDYPLLESVNRDRTFLLGLDCSSVPQLINRRRQRIDYDYNNYATKQRHLAIAKIIYERDAQKEVFSAIGCPVLQTSDLSPEKTFAKALALYKDFASKHPLARQINESALPNIPKFIRRVSGVPSRDNV